MLEHALTGARERVQQLEQLSARVVGLVQGAIQLPGEGGEGQGANEVEGLPLEDGVAAVQRLVAEHAAIQVGFSVACRSWEAARVCSTGALPRGLTLAWRCAAGEVSGGVQAAARAAQPATGPEGGDPCVLQARCDICIGYFGCVESSNLHLLTTHVGPACRVRPLSEKEEAAGRSSACKCDPLSGSVEVAAGRQADPPCLSWTLLEGQCALS